MLLSSPGWHQDHLLDTMSSVPSDTPLSRSPALSPAMSAFSVELPAEPCIVTIPGAVAHNARYFINDDMSIFRVSLQLL